MSTITVAPKPVANPFREPQFQEPLPFPDTPELITHNAIKLAGLSPNPRHRLIFQNLTRHLHAFVRETDITTEELMTAIQFLNETGSTARHVRQEFKLLSDVLGVTALIDAMDHPQVGNATPSSPLGPFHTDDSADISLGQSIASEGKGHYLYVQGRVLDTKGRPISDTQIETWEADGDGLYDKQYKGRDVPDCRGRLRSDAEGNFMYRAVVPRGYPIPGDGPVGAMLEAMHRHNNRPAHLHMMFEAPGYDTLTTAVYPEGEMYLKTDVVFGVKTPLVVKFETIDSDAEAKARGFPKGGPFKLVELDIVLLTEEEAKAARK